MRRNGTVIRLMAQASKRRRRDVHGRHMAATTASGRAGRSRPAAVQVVAVAAAIALLATSHVPRVSSQQLPAVGLTVNAYSEVAEVSPIMQGVFLEEINRLGEVLHAEMISNMGFEAHGRFVPSRFHPWFQVGDAPKVVVGTETAYNVFPENPVVLRMVIDCGGTDCGSRWLGVANLGHSLSMRTTRNTVYSVSLWARTLGTRSVTLAFLHKTRAFALGSTTVTVTAARDTMADPALTSSFGWVRVTANVRVTRTSSSLAHFFVGVDAATAAGNRTGDCTIWIDTVSVMQRSIRISGRPWRPDLFQRLQALRPAFLRFPGGTYVEGKEMHEAFRWRQTVGPQHKRMGRWGAWGYWSDDNMGLYEYFLLAEHLGAEPVWVFNAGMSQTGYVGPESIKPFIDDVLDGIQFAVGSGTQSRWGRVRASMGHVRPFNLRYVAVGNENCRRGVYPGLFTAFAVAIKAAYPSMKVISNCLNGPASFFHRRSVVRPDTPTPLADAFDLHYYGSANELWALAGGLDRYDVDANNLRGSGAVTDVAPGNDGYYGGTTGAPDSYGGAGDVQDVGGERVAPVKKVFVSEYACKGDVGCGNGTVIAAVAEAALIIGMERNAEKIMGFCYAPTVGNTNYPSNWMPVLIHSNGAESFVTPSYHVHAMFAAATGSRLVESRLSLPRGPRRLITASVTRGGRADNVVFIKLANMSPQDVRLVVTFADVPAACLTTGLLTKLHGKGVRGGPQMATNSFAAPSAVAPRQEVVGDFSQPVGYSNRVVAVLDAFSVGVLRVDIVELCN